MRKREMESMSAPAASTTAPKIAAYEKILRGYFGVPQNLVYLLEETTPSFVYETLDQDFDMIFFNISPLHPLLLEKLRRRRDRKDKTQKFEHLLILLN